MDFLRSEIAIVDIVLCGVLEIMKRVSAYSASVWCYWWLEERVYCHDYRGILGSVTNLTEISRFD